MENMNSPLVGESEREQVLGLQELPEHGGRAVGQLLPSTVTSFVSIDAECESITTISITI